jgi:COMPASS component SWD1
MKAEEEDVDIDSFVVATSPPAGAGLAGRVTRDQSVTPDHGSGGSPALINGTANPNAGAKTNGNGNGHLHPSDNKPNGTLSDGDDSKMVVDTNVNSTSMVDPDTLWAEEDPDDDIPGGWRMRVLIEKEEDE